MAVVVVVVAVVVVVLWLWWLWLFLLVSLTHDAEACARSTELRWLVSRADEGCRLCQRNPTE